mgnify:FL=1
MHTTLNEIRAHEPCKDGWTKLLKHLGKTEPDDEPLRFVTILDSNGIIDAIWCLRVRPAYDLKVMEFKLKCARRVESLDKSGKAKKCLDVVEKFIKGEANIEDLDLAYASAASAAYAAAAYAAAYAAYAAYAAAAYAASAAASAYAAYAAAAYAAASAASTAAAYAAYAAAYAAYAAAEREYQRQIFLKIFSED